MNDFTKEELQIIYYMIGDWSSPERYFTKFMDVKNKVYEILNGDVDWVNDDE